MQVMTVGLLSVSLGLLATVTPVVAVDTDSQPHRHSATAMCGSTESSAHQFVDVPLDHTHSDAISCIAQLRITIGYGDGTFRPGRTVNRRQMALFLSRASAMISDIITVAGFPHPADYDSESPEAQAAIAVVLTKGIMRLYPDQTFRGDNLVTRADMVEMLINLLATSTRSGVHRTPNGGISFESPPPKEPDNGFPDTASPAAEAAYLLEITRGYGDGTFRPNVAVTRAQMAAFITRTLAHAPSLPTASRP